MLKNYYLIVLKMSVESFREICNQWKFYRFRTLEDFDKWIDYDGINQRKRGVKFNRWVIDNYKDREFDIMTNACPTKYWAYWITK